VSRIPNAVALGAAGPALQGIAKLTMGQIADFSDLAHVRKALKSSETIENVESIAISDVIDWRLDYIEERATVQLMDAIQTQDPAFMITKAATAFSQYCESVSEDVALPSQVVVSEPGKGVDHIQDHTEESLPKVERFWDST
jgi:hypothetical protein